jgi:ribosomal protein S18 acetylase RimI-like enzyme
MREIDLSDTGTLIHELETNLWETWSNFGRGPGCTLNDEGDALWFETPIPIIPYNGILRFRISDDAERRIESLAGHFRRRSVAFMWVVHPSSLPEDLPELLGKHGLSEIDVMPGMARSLAGLPRMPLIPEGIEIRKVLNPADASAFYQFAAWRWQTAEEHREHYAAIAEQFRLGEPDSRAHIWQAWRGGQPVAKAGMYMGSGSAGIYGVVTRPEARHLGLARILTLTAVYAARRSGYRLAVLHSSPMAEGLYKSLGFETVASFRLFASEDAHI